MEYAVLLGLKMGSLFNLNSFGEVFSVLGVGILATVLGYLIKGEWGSALALLAGAILFLYL